MATYNYKPGLGLTAAYQVSGVPYAKGQTLHLELKVSELYYTGSVSSFGVLAGLTFIATDQIDNGGLSPSGSNWSGSLNALVG